MDNTSHVSSQLVDGGITPAVRLHREKALEACAWFPWHTPVPFLLYPLVLIHLSHEHDERLSSPCQPQTGRWPREPQHKRVKESTALPLVPPTSLADPATRSSPLTHVLFPLTTLPARPGTTSAPTVRPELQSYRRN